MGSRSLYLEVMRETWGIAHRWACFAVLLVGLMGAVPAVAQQTPDDAAAREYFERGRVAFEQADYEGALAYFRHAYRLSHRGELQYNIGVASQRCKNGSSRFDNRLQSEGRPSSRSRKRPSVIKRRRTTAHAFRLPRLSGRVRWQWLVLPALRR